MNNPSMHKRRLRIWSGIAVFVALTGIYIYSYQFNPFPSGVADIVTSGLVVVGAALAGWMSTLVARHYGKNTPPRLLWLYFALAVWGWTIGEAIWAYQYLTGGPEAAQLSLADGFWVVSYFLFIAAQYRQYVLIYRPDRRTSAAYISFALIAVLMFTYLYGIWLLGKSPDADPFTTYLNAFYAIGDIALSIGALVIVFAFRDGALGRPWLGLLVFAFSDLLYAWLDSSGLYAWSVEQGNLLTTITDTTYFAAYLVIAFGCYLQLILLTFGPRLKYDQ